MFPLSRGDTTAPLWSSTCKWCLHSCLLPVFPSLWACLTSVLNQLYVKCLPLTENIVFNLKKKQKTFGRQTLKAYEFKASLGYRMDTLPKGGGEITIAQLVKCLMNKPKNLRFRCQHHVTSWVRWHMPVIPSLGSPRTLWPSFANWWAPSSLRDPVSKNR